MRNPFAGAIIVCESANFCLISYTTVKVKSTRDNDPLRKSMVNIIFDTGYGKDVVAKVPADVVAHLRFLPTMIISRWYLRKEVGAIAGYNRP